ncbi:MAG: cytochrome c [Nitrospirota bacterium]|jgi:hypothetical protein
MKKYVLALTLLAIFGITTIAFTVDHGRMHEMMMRQGGSKIDERTELKLPAPMKVMQKSQMRQHLATIGEITSALAQNDLKKAEAITRSRLGWTEEEEKQCSMVTDITGEPDFLKYGKAMHMKAEELSNAAKSGNRDRAIYALGELINNCNACHYRFRH